MNGYNPNFDLDLKFGEFGEKLIESLFKDKGKIECKRDRKTKDTGNVAVEFRYRGKPSGIAVTKADWYCFIITDNVIITIKTDVLKDIARGFYRLGSVVKGGDDDASDMILIPIEDLVRYSMLK